MRRHEPVPHLANGAPATVVPVPPDAVLEELAARSGATVTFSSDLPVEGEWFVCKGPDAFAELVFRPPLEPGGFACSVAAAAPRPGGLRMALRLEGGAIRDLPAWVPQDGAAEARFFTRRRVEAIRLAPVESRPFRVDRLDLVRCEAVARELLTWVDEALAVPPLMHDPGPPSPAPGAAALAALWKPEAHVVGEKHVEVVGTKVCVTRPGGFVEVAFTRRLPAGWYRIEAELVTDRYIRPRLLLPGEAYLWGVSGWLLRQTGPGRYGAFVRSPRRIARVLFKPSEFPAPVEVRGVRFTRIPAAAVVGDAVRTAARLRTADPARFRRFVRGAALTPFRRRSESFSTGETLPGPELRERYYRDWIEHHERTTSPPRFAREEPPVSFVVLIDAVAASRDAIAQTLASLADQGAADWRAVVAIAENRPEAEVAAAGGRARGVAIVRVDTCADRAGWLQVALDAAGTSHVVVLEAGERLAPKALVRLAAQAQVTADAALIHSDEDRVTPAGERIAPAFFGAFDLDLVLSRGWPAGIGGAAAIRVDAARTVGGFRTGTFPAHRLDLVLRLVERFGREAIVHVPLVALHHPADEPPTRRAVSRVLAGHLRRMRPDADVVQLPYERGYRARYRLEREPRASLLVCVRDRPQLTRRFLASLEANTDYGNRELVIVDNGSTDEDALGLLAEQAARPGTRVLRDPRPFNFAALNNLAAAQAGGEVLVLLNNDLVFSDPGWLRELVTQALRPGVGCVGAKLLYPNGRIQHAGIVLGGEARALHCEAGLSARESGYLGRLFHVQQMLGVTGAAMAVRRRAYLDAGGMDAARFAVAFNDIDLCLRLRAAGLGTLWTPFAVIEHSESVSRGADQSPRARERFFRESAHFFARWRDLIGNDPYYPAGFGQETATYLPRR